MKSDNWQDALKALLPDDYTPEPEETAAPPTPKPQLTVTLDRKRAGKTATIVSGFDADDPDASRIAADLKKRLACGGSARGGEILVQGDRRREVIDYLRTAGYKVR